MLRVVLGAVAAAAVIVAFLQTWDRSRGLDLPPLGTLLLAAALIAIGLYCGAQGWVYLLGKRGSRALAATFYLSQIGKYLPGALWQPAGQLAMAVTTGIPAPAAATAVPVYMLTLIAAGGTLGLGLTAAVDGGVIRFLALLGVIPVLLLRRSWMVSALDRLHRRSARIPEGGVVPDQRAILGSYAWSLGVMLTTGTAFFLLLSASEQVSFFVAVCAFAFAWTVGFLALPVPAGLGIREAVLVAAIAVDPGAILAASIVYRLVSIATEVAVVGISRADARLRPVE